MSYKLAIFDMDGTILNTLEDLANGVNHALAADGMPTRTMEYVRSIVGNGIYTTLRLCAPENISDEQLESLHTHFAPYYEVHRADNTRPYDGIETLLKKLKAAGVKTAVVSNKSDISVKPLCEKYFKGLFDVSQGVMEGVPKKPAPDMVEKIVSGFGLDKKDVIYIGDSEVDIQTAANARIDGVFVSWGFRTEEQLKKNGAGIVFGDTDAVLKHIIGKES